MSDAAPPPGGAAGNRRLHGIATFLGRIAGLDRSVIVLSSVVVLGAVMSIIDTTIVNIALETLSRELQAPLDEVQWVSTAYLLALATVIPLTGWAAERFGPRRVWIASVVTFTASSVLSGLAPSIEVLIGSRVLQGLAGGMIMPVGVIVLAQAAGPRRMGRVMSVIGVPTLLGPVLGPVLGGVILEFLSWRWIFFVNVPIGLVGVALGLRLLPEGRAEGARPDGEGRLDWIGLALLSPGAGLLVYGLSEVASRGGGISSFPVWGPIVAGLLLITLFVLHARRAPDPLIDVRLIARRARYAAAATAAFAVGMALFGTLLLLPLYFQISRGETILATGLLLAPQGLGAAAAMPLAGRLTDRIGGGRVALVGIVLLSAGTFVFTRVASNPPVGLLEAALVVRGVGLGASMMPVSAAAYATLSSGEVPRATSALNVIRRIGGSVGTALLAVVLATALTGAVGGGAAGLEGVRSLPPAQRADATASIAGAFATSFWWSLALAAVAVVPIAILALLESDDGDGGGDGDEGEPGGREQEPSAAAIAAGARS